MAAPLSSKERVSQLVHGESRGEKGGVAGDPRSHSDNSKNPQNVVLASWHEARTEPDSLYKDSPRTVFALALAYYRVLNKIE